MATVDVKIRRLPGSSDIPLPAYQSRDAVGMDLHAALQNLAPEQAAKMAFMTGGAFSRDASEFFDHIPNATIEKPFKAAGLRALVRGLIREA